MSRRIGAKSFKGKNNYRVQSQSIVRTLSLSLVISLSLTDTLISLSLTHTHTLTDTLTSLSLILYLIIYPSLSLSYFNRYHCNILVLITLHCLTTMLFVSPFLSMAATSFHRSVHSSFSYFCKKLH